MSGWLPTRLIDVSGQKQEPRLRITSGMSLQSLITRFNSTKKLHNPLIKMIDHISETQGVPYLILSHCWGKPPHDESHMTKLATLSARLDAILFSGLPKTFQDMIIIARNLEIPYVWIDTFCIIQDSTVDWEREAASMAKVYSGSLCTIAASNSDNWTGGCFVPRDIAKTTSCDLYWPRGEDGLESEDVSLTIFPRYRRMP